MERRREDYFYRDGTAWAVFRRYPELVFVKSTYPWAVLHKILCIYLNRFISAILTKQRIYLILLDILFIFQFGTVIALY